jgi:hypothetical protein
LAIAPRVFAVGTELPRGWIREIQIESVIDAAAMLLHLYRNQHLDTPPQIARAEISRSDEVLRRSRVRETINARMLEEAPDN